MIEFELGDITKFKKFKDKKTETTAGIVFILNRKILLLHPSKEKWRKSFSYPKGHIDDGESVKQSAIRETEEEIGVTVSDNLLKNKNLYRIVTENDRGIIRIDYYYVVYLNDNLFRKLFKERSNIKKSKLQTKEIDWGGFMTAKQAADKIKPRLRRVLVHLL
jgi:ADP-ribose pyrophosphatase YjhB (NUDIX family)